MSLFHSEKHGRAFMNCLIEFVLDPFTTDEIYEGMIENISESGFCLITSQPLEENQEITIKSIIYLPSHTATVCWIQKSDEVYKAGLRFI